MCPGPLAWDKSLRFGGQLIVVPPLLLESVSLLKSVQQFSMPKEFCDLLPHLIIFFYAYNHWNVQYLQSGKSFCCLLYLFCSHWFYSAVIRNRRCLLIDNVVVGFSFPNIKQDVGPSFPLWFWWFDLMFISVEKYHEFIHKVIQFVLIVTKNNTFTSEYLVIDYIIISVFDCWSDVDNCIELLKHVNLDIRGWFHWHLRSKA